MAKIFQILSLLFILTSCSEKFDYVNPTAFNKKISRRTDIKTAEELIKLYYNYPQNERFPHLTIQSKEIDNGFVEITLIHDDQEDDSMRAIKIIMIAKLKNKKWSVMEIKTNRKCWDGRGHQNWSTEPCN